MFLSGESNRYVREELERGNLARACEVLEEVKKNQGEVGVWAFLSADLIKLYVQQSRFPDAERVYEELTERLRLKEFSDGFTRLVSVFLCVMYVLFPDAMTTKISSWLAGALGSSRCDGYILDALLWGIFWQSLPKAQTMTLLLCLNAKQQSKEQRIRSFGMLAYCLSIRGYFFWGILGLKKAVRVSGSKGVSTQLRKDMRFWLGISYRWRSYPQKCLKAHATFESDFPEAEGFYQIIANASRLQLSIAERGPLEVDSSVKRCESSSISMTEGRNHMQIYAGKACLLALLRREREYLEYLERAGRIALRVSDTLDFIIYYWLATVAHLNAENYELAGQTLDKFLLYQRRYGDTDLYRQETDRILALMRLGPKPGFGRRIHETVKFILLSVRYGNTHRFFRALRIGLRWLFVRTASYWATDEVASYLQGCQRQDELSSFQTGESLLLEVTEELAKLTRKALNDEPDLHRSIEAVSSVLHPEETILGKNIAEIVDRASVRFKMSNSVVINESANSVRMACEGGRYLIVAQGRATRSEAEGIAIGFIIKTENVFSVFLTECALNILLGHHLFLLEAWDLRQREWQIQTYRAIAETTQMLAHDVRKPLSMSRMFIDVLSAMPTLEEVRASIDRFLPDIEKALRSVNGMLSDIIEVGSPAPPIRDTAIFESLVDASFAEVFSTAKSLDIEFFYDFKHTHCLSVDTLKVTRLFSNIIGNAVQAMKGQGSIWLNTREISFEGTKVVEVTIGNSNSIISAEELSSIFDMFYSRKKGGSGLGLAIAKKVVMDHGGQIQCFCDKRGVEFKFTLPLALETKAVRRALPERSSHYRERWTQQASDHSVSQMGDVDLEMRLREEFASFSAKMKRPMSLLIVDDEALYRNAFADLLSRVSEKTGVVTQFAVDFEDAKSKIRSSPFDLIIADVDLGGSDDGFDLVREIRKRGLSSEICVHSNRFLPGDSRRAMDVGADAFLPKPMTSVNLLRLLISSEKARLSENASEKRGKARLRGVVASVFLACALMGTSVAFSSTDEILYPPREAYRTGMLEVSGGHSVYFEEVGNPEGKPAVFVHGGPGLGSASNDRRFFDPSVYRIVLFDQRGSGRSQAKDMLFNNTTYSLIDDMEQLRAHLKIPAWLVLGGSWGSLLSLAYAEAHPETVTELIVRGILLGTQAEDDWLFNSEGVAKHFPSEWRRLLSESGVESSANLFDALYSKIMDPDPSISMRAARAWNEFEDAIGTYQKTPSISEDDALSLCRARIEFHYFKHHYFMTGEDPIIKNSGRLQKISGVVIHGEHDMNCPVSSAYRLSKAWPNAELVIVPNAGHSVSERGMQSALVKATDRFKCVARIAGAGH